MKVIHSSDKEAIAELEKLYGEPPMDLSGIPTRALMLEMMCRGNTCTYSVDSPNAYTLNLLFKGGRSGPTLVMVITD